MVRVYPFTPQSQLKNNSRATVPLSVIIFQFKNTKINVLEIKFSYTVAFSTLIWHQLLKIRGFFYTQTENLSSNKLLTALKLTNYRKVDTTICI